MVSLGNQQIGRFKLQTCKYFFTSMSLQHSNPFSGGSGGATPGATN